MRRGKQEGKAGGAAVVGRSGRGIAADILAVEAAVAAACGALQGVRRAGVAEGHELAAAVDDVAADGGGVVTKALAVESSGFYGRR